jgi:hypothetical protein
MTTFKARIIALLVPSLAFLAFAASPALAETETLKPWWHVTSGSRPSVIDPQAAGNAVRQLTVSASSGTYELLALIDGAETKSGTLSAGEEPQGVKQMIETMYGSAVEVTAKAGPNNANEVYEITFVGLEHRYPPTINVWNEHLVGGSRSASVKQLVEGRPAGVLVDTVENVGDTLALATGSPVRIVDSLPSGLQATGAVAIIPSNNTAGQVPCVKEASGSRVSCTFSGSESELEFLNFESLGGLPPYQYIEVRVDVEQRSGASPNGEANVVGVSGGGAPSKTVSRPVRVGDEPASFGVEDFELTPEEAGGGLDARAGSHPFETGFDLALNQDIEENEEYDNKPRVRPVTPAKDLHFKLPPGLVGNPTAIPRCTIGQFLTAIEVHNECPADSAVGVATVSYLEPELSGTGFTEQTLPVFNIEPQVGEPARFGFYVPIGRIGVFINTQVRTGGDYGVTSTTGNITQAVAFVSANVSLWGAPGATAHDGTRGWGCLAANQGVDKEVQVEAYGGECKALGVAHPPAFLSLPTSCSGVPLQSSVEADAWQNPGNFLTGENVVTTQAQPLPTLSGCNQLQFVPEIKVKPDGTEASKPTGLNVDVHVPQEGQLNAEGLAQSNIKDIAVTLPAGVTLNPSAADGLEACTGNASDAPGVSLGNPGNEIGFEGVKGLPLEPGVSSPAFSPYVPGSTAAKAAIASHEVPESDGTGTLEPGRNFCPDGSKVGEVTITTPLLPKGDPVKGFVYLASPQNFGTFPQENLFGTHVALYIVAEDPVSGSLVKLPGKTELGGEPGVEGLALGQIRGTFEDNPQLPFEDAELHFFGGERAPLASPSLCRRPGEDPAEEGYVTQATFTPWDGEAPVHSSSRFFVTSGPGGGPCPNPFGDRSASTLPWAPSLASGTTNNNAGAFSALTTTLSRPPGDQNIQQVTLHYPPGLSGLLSGVELCAEAQANAGTCGPNSQIGETIVSVGVGGDPFTVTGGKAYITGPYAGAPFGLSIVNPAKAGPFDLQEGRPVVVRAKIEVDPTTAALTITTNTAAQGSAIPTIIEGFPLQIQHVNVLVNRPGFTFNPTNCSKTEITSTIDSAEGASKTESIPFQATNCQALKFTPKFTASVTGRNSKGGGSALTATVSEPAGSLGSQANLTKVKVELPKQLPSRLTTLQQACLARTFEENPANCPKASKVGYAVVHTPLVPVPLQGPAIFVSHGNEAFPSLTLVLQGYGVTIDLVGTTFISKTSITSTTFKTVPDDPFSSFELTLPQGKFSALSTDLPHESYDLCGQKLTMPNEFIGQNGAEIHQKTNITVTGCSKVKAKKVRKRHKAKKGHKAKGSAKRVRRVS